MLKGILALILTSTFILRVAFAGGSEIIEVPSSSSYFKPFFGVYYNSLGVLNRYKTETLSVVNTPIALTSSRWTHFGGLGLMFGMKHNPYFGFVFGMNHQFRMNSKLSGVIPNSYPVQKGRFTTSHNSDLFYADVRSYLPLLPCVDLLGSIGAAYIQQHPTLTGELSNGGGSFSKVYFVFNHLVWRLGGGLNYFFTQNMGIEAMFHYMPTTGLNNPIRSFQDINIGLNYRFD